MIKSIRIENEMCYFNFDGNLSLLNSIRREMLSNAYVFKMIPKLIRVNHVELKQDEIEIILEKIYVNNQYLENNFDTNKDKSNVKFHIDEKANNEMRWVMSDSINFTTNDGKMIDARKLIRTDIPMIILRPGRTLMVRGSLVRTNERSKLVGLFAMTEENNVFKCNFNMLEIYSPKTIWSKTLKSLHNKFSNFYRTIDNLGSVVPNIFTLTDLEDGDTILRCIRTKLLADNINLLFTRKTDNYNEYTITIVSSNGSPVDVKKILLDATLAMTKDYTKLHNSVAKKLNKFTNVIYDY